MQRRQLSEFLKGCRARISPADLGLPDPRRRRTPGLRREDVAALAGVSVTWYTWLEQGRDIKVSAQVLEKISTTLRMSPDEREYLFALVQHRPAPPASALPLKAGDALKRMIDALDVPALVLNLRWDVVAWNQLVGRIFRDYAKLEPCGRNLLRILLTDPQYQQDPDDYEAIANRVLAKFRVDFSQAADDPDINTLVAELNQSCPMFRRLWGRTEVSNRSVGLNVVRHHNVGGITFEHSSYVPEGSPGLRVVIFVPHDDESRHKVASLRDDRSALRASRPN